MKLDKDLLFFFIKGLILYLLWYILYELYIKPKGQVDAWLNDSVALSASRIVRFLGYDTCVEGNSVCVNTVSTIHIGNGCNGLEIYAIFMGFIMLYKGDVKLKVIYILSGISIIYLCNLLRVSLLAIDHYKDLRMFQFNHKYTYLFAIYFIVFLLWSLWVVKFSNRVETHVS